MNKPINPIHWECYVTEPGKPVEKAKILDLRTLPEEVKVPIIQAALNVALRYDNGDYALEEDTEENDAMAELAAAVERVRHHMFQVDLTPLPVKENP